MTQDFKTRGKQMPYRVPAYFFARNEEALMRSIGRRRTLRTAWWIGAAASVAVALFVGVWNASRALPEGCIYAYSDEMADEELASWVEFYEADLFLSSNYQSE